MAMEFKTKENFDNDLKNAPSNRGVIFSSQSEKMVSKLPVDELKPFKDHPFKLYQGKRLDELVESIRELGVITPVVVRQLNDETYEILSGHNRVNAAKLAGLAEVPVVVKYHLPDDDALLIVTETNLMQRSVSDLCHSERARAFAKHMEAVKYTGVKKELLNEIKNLSNTDEIKENEQGGQFEHLEKNRDVIGEKFNLSGSSIARYLRIDVLVPELKSLIDNEEIPLNAGVDLSYMRPHEQKDVSTAIAITKHRVDLKIAKRLREKSKEKELNYDTIEKIITGAVPTSVKNKKEKSIPLPLKRISAYFAPDTKKAIIQNTIWEALEFYFAHKNNQSKD